MKLSLSLGNDSGDWVNMEKRIPQNDSLLSYFCHYVKFRVRVSVGPRFSVRVGFSVRISLVYNLNEKRCKSEKKPKYDQILGVLFSKMAGEYGQNATISRTFPG